MRIGGRSKTALAVAAIAALGSRADAASYAPLDCGKAASPAQFAICRNYSLGQAEARVATLFAIATSLVGMGQRGAIADAQRRWLSGRESCGGNLACLSNAYRTRINELSKVIDAIASHGPF